MRGRDEVGAEGMVRRGGRGEWGRTNEVNEGRGYSQGLGMRGE